MALHFETRRLVLRSLTEDDLPALQEGFSSCLPPQNRFDEGVFDTSFMTPEWHRGLIRREAEEAAQDRSYMLHIFHQATGKYLGYCDITTQYRHDIQFAKIGYTILNRYWNQGYAAEAVTALTQIGFQQLGFHRLEAHVNPDNPASMAVLRKCGYEYEGIRKAYILEDGVWTDNAVFYTLHSAEPKT